MTISKEQEAEILRYAHAEKWKVGTIARQLGFHHNTISRVLSDNGLPRPKREVGASILDPYLPFIVETLQQFPSLPASRLYDMARERGYTGGSSHFRSRIAELRPVPLPEAYLRLKTLPGEQAQVDWGHFGKITIGRAERDLMAFVMVLSWSRRIFLQFFLDARMSNFLRGHEGAFSAWNGVPRVLLYDNLKSAVLERKGDAIRFHPTLLEYSAHYRFEPRPVAIRRGNEKGRVERAIRYVRDNFWPARQWQDMDDLNTQAQEWCEGPTMQRPCPEDRTLTVAEAFIDEQPKLMPLPENTYPTDEQIEASIGKTPYIRFDMNDYSVPHTHVRKSVLVMASPSEVRVIDGGEVIAAHHRSYDKGEQIENPNHIQNLVEHKREARHHSSQDRLAHAAPASVELLIQAAERGDHLSSITTALLRALDEYGSQELENAINESLSRGVAHPNGVRQVLEQRREARQLPPPLSITLPENMEAQKIVVRPHDLAGYDQLQEMPENSDNEETS